MGRGLILLYLKFNGWAIKPGYEHYYSSCIRYNHLHYDCTGENYTPLGSEDDRKAEIKKAPIKSEPLEFMVPRGGIEPSTRGFSVLCSTDWATWAELQKSAIRLDYAALVNINVNLLRWIQARRRVISMKKINNQTKDFFHTVPYPWQQPDHQSKKTQR